MKRYYCLRCDNKNYISKDKSGNLTLTTNRDLALTYEEKDKQKLENIKTSLPKKLKHRNISLIYYEVEEKKDNDSKCVILEEYDRKDEICVNYTEGKQYKNVDFASVIQKIHDLSLDFKTMQDNQELYDQRLSDVDLEISDIHHYIEFYKFSASEAWYLCKMLQNVLDRRRAIKHEKDMVKMFSTQTCKAIAEGRTEDVFNIRNNCQYAPRILFDLYKGKENRRRDFH